MPRRDFEKHLRGAIKVDMTDILKDPHCLVPERRQTLPERLRTSAPQLLEELL